MSPRLTLAFAIPDHPWVDSADGAAVRIAMSVGTSADGEGELLTVEEELQTETDYAVGVTLRRQRGRINADLTMGADVSRALALRANERVSSPGVKLHGAGFIVTHEEATRLGLGTAPGLERHIRPYRNGRDLTDKPRDVLVIDLFGLGADELRARYPAVYQWVAERVKPEREAKGHNADGAAYARLWWLHGKPRPDLRVALTGLPRYIATVETAKHRAFQFLDSAITPDNKLIAIAHNDAFVLGVLSSRMHVSWALAAGSRLGVGNDPVYVKTRCFEPFPFPTTTPAQQTRIRELAEQLDAHRKRQQALHADLTLTGMYNVLEKLKVSHGGTALDAKEKRIHEQGLVAVLKSLHDELDRAVLAAYGWDDLGPLLEVANGNARPESAGQPDRAAALRALDAALLERLVALNVERAAEEARGLVRWLRPEFQNPQAAPHQETMAVDAEAAVATLTPGPSPKGRGEKSPWPDTLPEQVARVAAMLAESPVPLDAEAIAARHTGRGPWKKRLPQLLETLVALGRARQVPGGYAP